MMERPEARSGPYGVALVGAGQFGATFAAQVRRIPALSLRLVCDRDRAAARRALLSAGYAPERVRDCDSRTDALNAMETGALALVDDYRLITDLPLDVAVEATGAPDLAAAVAELALASGYHSALVTKEAEIVVGPILARTAREAGLVHTPVDGDQPALLLSLIARARGLGLPVIAAGKSAESDYVFDSKADTITAWGRTAEAPGYARLFGAADPVSALRERVVPGLETATVPDLCEMGIVANHAGLSVDRPDLHGPVARTIELARVFRPAAEGGILDRTGVVDVFACLRRPDELSFAGGVFAVVEASDAASGRLLEGKGIPGSGDGRYLLLHNPVHLLGAEAPASVITAVRDGRGSGGEEPRQLWDLVARADRAFAAGETLSLGARHAIPGARPELVPSAPLGPEAPAPYYLLPGAVLARAIEPGALIRGADVILAEGALLRLRREQDRLG